MPATVVRGLAILSVARVRALIISMFNLFLLLAVLSLLPLLLLYEFLVSLLLHYDVLGLLTASHPAHEPCIIEFLDGLAPLLLFNPVKLVDISDQGRNDFCGSIVLTKKSARPDLISATRTLLFDFAIVVLYAGGAELVQTLSDVDWVLVDVRANRTLKGGLLNLLEERHVDVILIVRALGLNEESRHAGHLIEVQVVVAQVYYLLS